MESPPRSGRSSDPPLFVTPFVKSIWMRPVCASPRIRRAPERYASGCKPPTRAQREDNFSPECTRAYRPGRPTHPRISTISSVSVRGSKGTATWDLAEMGLSAEVALKLESRARTSTLDSDCPGTGVSRRMLDQSAPHLKPPALRIRSLTVMSCCRTYNPGFLTAPEIRTESLLRIWVMSYTHRLSCPAISTEIAVSSEKRSC